jgi:hypothetical protein
VPELLRSFPRTYIFGFACLMDDVWPLSVAWASILSLHYIPSVRLSLRGFRLRLLMPLVRLLHELVLLLAIPFMGFAEKLVVIPFDLLEVV